MKKTVSIITLLLLILSFLVGCAPVDVPPTSAPTDPPATTQPKPSETTPPTTEPVSTTQPAEMQEFLPIRPIPDVYNISARWPEWDMTKLLSDEMKDYNPWVYPIWRDPTERSDWIMLMIQTEAANLVVPSANITEERLGKVAWLEVEWEYLNQKPMEKSIFPYLELNREDYLNVLPAGNVEIDSPYVMPEAYDVQIQDPNWFDRPYYWADPATAEVYPYWEGKEYRIAWIESLLGQYRILAQAGGIEMFVEGELEQIAWLEAQLEYLGAELPQSIFTTLNIDPADYLTAK